MRLISGLVLILFGVVYLGDSLSLWSISDFSVIYKYWPVILIFVGLSLIFKKWKYGNLLVIILFILLIFFLFYDIAMGKKLLPY